MTIQDALEVVANPSTPSETLYSLYNTGDFSDWYTYKLRSRIAAHPNIPGKLLPEITFRYAKYLYQNPALELIVLENPSVYNFLEYDLIRRNSLVKYARSAQLPAALALALSHNPSARVSEEARHHVALVGEAEGETWIEEVKTWLTDEVQKRKNNEWVRWWYRFEAFPPWLCKRLAWNLEPRKLTGKPDQAPTEPAPRRGEKAALARASHAELLALVNNNGQHPARLLLIAKECEKRKDCYNIEVAIINHYHAPLELVSYSYYYGRCWCPKAGSILKASTIYAAMEKAYGDRRIPWLRQYLCHPNADPTLCRQALRKYAHPVRLLRLLDTMRRETPLTMYSNSYYRDSYRDLYSEFPERLAAVLNPRWLWQPPYRRSRRRPDAPPCMKLADAYADDTHRWVRAAARAMQSDPTVSQRFWE
jgi:hypothetical protein